MGHICDVCKDEFHNVEALRRHRSNKHPGNNVKLLIGGKEFSLTVKDGKLSCPITGCNRTYEGRDSLRKHMRNGHGDDLPVEGRVQSMGKSPLEDEEAHTAILGRTMKQGARSMHQGRLVARKVTTAEAPSGTDLRQEQAGTTDLPESQDHGLQNQYKDGQVAVGEKEGVDKGKRTTVQLCFGETYLFRNDLLDRLGLWIHVTLRIAICRDCQVGLTSEHIVGHLKSKHGGVVREDDKMSLSALCQRMQVHVKFETVGVPKPGGPPVEGIAEPVSGYSCRAQGSCEYSVRDFARMLKHGRENHGSGIVDDVAYDKTMVQAIFAGIGRTYFEVDPSLYIGADLDTRHYLRSTFLPRQHDPVVTQDSERDRTQLLKATRWDEFERPIREDRAQCKAAHRLKDKHTAAEAGGIFVRLDEAVKQHHALTRQYLEAEAHSFTIRKILYYGLGFSPDQNEYFRPVLRDNVNYNSLYLQMVRSMVRLEIGHDFKMKYAYTTAQKKELDRLCTALRSDPDPQSEGAGGDADVVAAYHRFCWALIHSPEEQAKKQWENPIERFLWLMALRTDGSFLEAKDVTPIISKLKYFCRLLTLYQALALKDGIDDQHGDILRRVGRFHSMVLQLGQATLFNMLFELQKVVSSLAFKEPAEPSVYVDPAYAYISIGTESLYLERLREGMQTLIQRVKEIYLELSGESAWPVPPKGPYKDDLSNSRRGYSFLEESPFREMKDAFFLSIVERRRLGSFVANGQWAWDLRAVKHFLSEADRLWGHLVHALYVGVHLSTRVTQFLQHQLTNVDRHRNFMFQGEEAICVTRYSKTTNLRGGDSWVPAFLAEPLKDLLLVLLGGGFREAQALLAGVVHGPNARWLYRSYLCVEDGERIPEDRFYSELPKRNRMVFSCGWGARAFRQGMVTLGREFISAYDAFAFADEGLAMAADHSSETDVAHYAIVHGALPQVTNNEMNRQRLIGREWGSLLGLGPMPPPKPVHTRHREVCSPHDVVQASAEVDKIAERVLKASEEGTKKAFASIGLTTDIVELFVRLAKRKLEPRTAIVDMPDPEELDPTPSSTSIPCSVPHRNAMAKTSSEDSVNESSGCSVDPFYSTAPEHTSLVASETSFKLSIEKHADFPFGPSSGSVYALSADAVASGFEDDPYGDRPAKRARLCRRSSPQRMWDNDTQEDGHEGEGEGGSSKGPSRLESFPNDALMHSMPIFGSPTPACLVGGDDGLQLTKIMNPSIFDSLTDWENIRAAMQLMLRNPDAREKSKAQMCGILMVLRGRQDALITMRTGGGKSMLWMVPPKLDPDIKLIVVCPFSALLDEQYSKARASGLRAVSYGERADVNPEIEVLFVQVEHVTSPRFRSIMEMSQTPTFTHLVVDEHHDHLICPADRKNAWRGLAEWASKLKLRIILLSATVPVMLESRFLKPYCLEKGNTARIRGRTNRPEIGLHTVILPAHNEERTLAHLVFLLQTKLKDNERMLVFFNSRQGAESFGFLYDCAVYHSDLPASGNTKASNLARWDSGETKIMACTSAFGVGIDRPNIRFAVVFNPTYSLMSTLQMVGRAGRDGRESHAFFVTSEDPPSASFRANGESMIFELKQLVHAKKCKVLQAMTHMDGDNVAQRCVELPGQVLCDICDPDGEVHQFALQAVQNLPAPHAYVAARALRQVSSENVASGSTNATFGATLAASGLKPATLSMHIPLSPNDVHCLNPGNRIPPGMLILPESQSQQHPSMTPMVERQVDLPSSLPHMDHHLLRAGKAAEAQQGRLDRTVELDRYMPKLKGMCPYHFVTESQLVEDHYPRCNVELGLPWRNSFQHFRKAFFFDKFAYCFFCGMPQDRRHNGEAPACHGKHVFTPKEPCEFNGFIFRATFCIWNDVPLRSEMIATLGVTAEIDTIPGFTRWATSEESHDGKYHNCLEVFLWFCRRQEKKNSRFFS